VLISGDRDPVAPPPLAAAYAAKMRRAHIEDIVFRDTGHVELIAPGSAAWSRTARIIDSLVR
jgi:pimeloyl-ACP methyl ester carboxylesterase